MFRLRMKLHRSQIASGNLDLCLMPGTVWWNFPSQIQSKQSSNPFRNTPQDHMTYHHFIIKAKAVLCSFQSLLDFWIEWTGSCSCLRGWGWWHIQGVPKKTLFQNHHPASWHLREIRFMTSWIWSLWGISLQNDDSESAFFWGRPVCKSMTK